MNLFKISYRTVAITAMALLSMNSVAFSQHHHHGIGSHNHLRPSYGIGGGGGSSQGGYYNYDYDHHHHHHHHVSRPSTNYVYYPSNNYIQPTQPGTYIRKIAARFQNASGGRGAMLVSSNSNSPVRYIQLDSGSTASLKRNDRIIEIDGEHVHNVSDLTRILNRSSGHVHFAYVDSRTNRTYHGHFDLVSGGSTSQSNRFGAQVRAHHSGGVIVTSVASNSPAVRLRDEFGDQVYLESGDIITSINGEYIEDVQHYHQLIRESSRNITLTIEDVNSGSIDQYTARLNN